MTQELEQDCENACALCGRQLGDQIERHHLVPRKMKGRETVAVHPICHRKIHALFTERELARKYNTPEALRAHTEIATFIQWLQKKPPDFYAPTKSSRR